ncbi:MAG: hypothetical protein V4812_00175 [Pseudomonadota bacterium]
MKDLSNRPAMQYGGWLFCLAALGFAGLAVVGTYQHYSPVPFWDMWNGYLEFYLRTGDEGWTPWWELHNEHRLVLPKAIFWLELHFLGGSLMALFVLNLLLALGVFLGFGLIVRELIPQWRHNPAALMLLGLLGVLSFSWVQMENFTWAFQSQFFLSYLVPLLAFGVLALARTRASTGCFILALVLGVASAGTMANGVLALPLLTLLAAVLRMGWPRVLLLALLAAAVITLYFTGYQTPVGHGSLLETLQTQPLELIEFVLLNLGAPLFFMADGSSHLLPKLGGFFLIGSSAFFAWRLWQDGTAKPQQWALLAFLLFVGGTALATGGGRVLMGMDHALTSRYMTPVLMAWCALLILYFSYLGTRFSDSLWTLGVFALVPALLLPSQLTALEPPPHLYDRHVAGLALELGVADAKYIDKVYFNIERALSIADRARPLQLSVFGSPGIVGAHRRLGEMLAVLPQQSCLGSLDIVTPLGEAATFVRLQGWLYEPHLKQVPQTLLMLDPAGVVVGYALSGQARGDVAAVVAPQAANSGFIGYLRTGVDSTSIRLVGQQPSCLYAVP